MAIFRYLALIFFCVISSSSVLSAQADRRDVRKGNRDFRKGDYKEAEIDYRKALVKDSTSFASNFNLGNTLYRMDDLQQASKSYEALKEVADASPYAADYYYNLGNAALSGKDYQAAADAFKQSLLRNPSDLDAKENYIYAKLMLKNRQDNREQNQDNKDNPDNQEDNQDQNKDGQDDKQDGNQDRNNEDGDKGNNDSQAPQPQQGQQPKITPQAAQQMLQAIQAKEKETQEKVNKEKAEAMKSRQKEKNW